MLQILLLLLLLEEQSFEHVHIDRHLTSSRFLHGLPLVKVLRLLQVWDVSWELSIVSLEVICLKACVARIIYIHNFIINSIAKPFKISKQIFCNVLEIY